MNKDQFNIIVKKLLETKDENGNALNIHDLLIYEQNGGEFQYQFRSESGKSDIRSISKTVMTLLVGIIIEKSKRGAYPDFNEETYVYPILKPYINITNKKNIPFIKQLKIKHLLTHTMGFEDVLMMRDDIVDVEPKEYINITLNHPIIHEPGTYYLYSNAGFYTLSVVLEHFLGESLLEFAKREFFDKLDIKDYKWEKYGDYCAGATRLWLKPHDLLKIAKLFINNGKYEQTVIVNEEWLIKMRVKTSLTPFEDVPDLTFRRYAYGYGMWLGKKDYYFGYGTDGQTMIILPKNNVVIITLSKQVDVKPIEKILSEVLEMYGV